MTHLAARTALAAIAVCLIVVGMTWLSGAMDEVNPAMAAAAVPLDTALRTVDSVEEFSDYLSITRSRYASDVREAFELGLVVGKYDADSNFYDPDALVTTGEMANILARNLGADRSVQGQAALSYLGSMGVTVASSPDSALTLGELSALTSQIQGLGVQAKADLLVLRQAAAGTLASDSGGGITRAHAVAMYRPGDDGYIPGYDGGTAPAEEESGQGSDQPAQPTIPPPNSGGGKSNGRKPKNNKEPEQPAHNAPVEPLFILTG